MNQDIENIIKKWLKKHKDDGQYVGDYDGEFDLENCCLDGDFDLNDLADEVLKVVVEATIKMLKDESMLAECITKTLGFGHHYSTMPVLRGIVSKIEKKLLSEHLSPNKENENNE